MYLILTAHPIAIQDQADEGFQAHIYPSPGSGGRTHFHLSLSHCTFRTRVWDKLRVWQHKTSQFSAMNAFSTWHMSPWESLLGCPWCENYTTRTPPQDWSWAPIPTGHTTQTRKQQHTPTFRFPATIRAQVCPKNGVVDVASAIELQGRLQSHLGRDIPWNVKTQTSFSKCLLL